MTEHRLATTLFRLASGQRWFSGRAGTPVGVRVGDWVVPPTGGAGLRPAELTVEFTDRPPEDFLIPLLYRGSDPVDACDDAGVLLDALAAGRPGFHARRPIPRGLPPRRFTGEQSNTTVFFGDRLLMKVFRRIERGPNVDVEVHTALAGTGTVAEVYGTWRVVDTDYAIFLEALPDPVDGFDLARQSASAGTDFTGPAERLGAALRDLHAALAQRLGTATVRGGDVAATLSARFAQVTAAHPEVTAYAGAAAAAFSGIPDQDLPAQRIHGDCHLGQVLLTGGRFVFVDFEGEPLRPLAERRRADSPLRDVAGMLRSLDYAAALGEAPATWLSDARAAFLSGYRGAAATDPLLAAYETDKAGYEVSYEARFRPQLLRVPIDFLAALPLRSS